MFPELECLSEFQLKMEILYQLRMDKEEKVCCALIPPHGL